MTDPHSRRLAQQAFDPDRRRLLLGAADALRRLTLSVDARRPHHVPAVEAGAPFHHP